MIPAAQRGMKLEWFEFFHGGFDLCPLVYLDYSDSWQETKIINLVGLIAAI